MLERARCLDELERRFAPPLAPRARVLLELAAFVERLELDLQEKLPERGADFYRVPRNQESITLAREEGLAVRRRRGRRH